jgi:hypothetical protein
MSRHYFTFGQVHVHSVNGKVFDKDCVVQIDADDADKAREIMVEHFGQKWAFQHSQGHPPDMTFYPRGIIPLIDTDGGL